MNDTGAVSRGLTLLFALLLMTGCTRKNPEPSASGIEATPGAVLFSTYCQSCHGQYATGDGPVAAELTVKPPDLTRLLDKYGTFPVELVSMTIDGRAQVEAHGSREMPVWGNIWNDPSAGPVAEERVQEQIGQLVEFLKSIQAPPTVPPNP